jgi:hypothetical protein
MSVIYEEWPNISEARREDYLTTLTHPDGWLMRSLEAMNEMIEIIVWTLTYEVL